MPHSSSSKALLSTVRRCPCSLIIVAPSSTRLSCLHWWHVSALRGGDARSAQSSSAAAKKAKWKQQSDQLRAAMQANRQIQEAQANGQDIKSIKFQAADPEDDDRWGARREMQSYTEIKGRKCGMTYNVHCP